MGVHFKLILIFPLMLLGLTSKAADVCPSNASDWNAWWNDYLDVMQGNLVPTPGSDSERRFWGTPDQRAIFHDCINKENGPLKKELEQCFDLPYQMLKKRSGESSSLGEGVSASNDEYEKRFQAETDINRIPKLLRDQKTLKEINDPSLFQSALSKIKKNSDWDVIEDDHTGMTNSARRLVVRVKGPERDLVVRYNLSKKDSDPHGFLSDMNVVTIQKVENGKKLNPPIIHFQAFDFQPNTQSPSYELKVIRDPNALARSNNRSVCFECHQGNLIFLTPDRSEQDLNKLKAIANLNTAFLNYGPIKYSGANISNLNLGPSIGPIDSPVRTDEFMKSCAPHTRSNRLSQIRKSMNCMNCHDGSEVKPLYMGGRRPFFINHMVIELGVMPPENKLNTEEKNDLVNCLFSENKILLKNQFAEQGCTLEKNRILTDAMKALNTLNLLTPPHPACDKP